MAHWLLKSGALHLFDDKKASHFYSLILVILYFLASFVELLSFFFDQSGFQ